MDEKQKAAHVRTLRKYYDTPTLREWLRKYGHITTGKRGEQVPRWRRVIKELTSNDT